jgi:hypothetical protein
VSTVTDHRTVCGPILSTSFLTVTSMTFQHIDLLGVLALQRQRELIETASDQRLVREARRAHPSHRWRRSPKPPHAA